MFYAEPEFSLKYPEDHITVVILCIESASAVPTQLRGDTDHGQVAPSYPPPEKPQSHPSRLQTPAPAPQQSTPKIEEARKTRAQRSGTTRERHRASTRDALQPGQGTSPGGVRFPSCSLALALAMALNLLAFAFAFSGVGMVEAKAEGEVLR